MTRTEGHLRAAEAQFMHSWLTYLGPTHSDRIHRINAIYEERTATIYGTSFWDESFNYEGMELGIWSGIERKVQKYQQKWMYMAVSRSLAGMDYRERTFLQLTELLNSAYSGTVDKYRNRRTVLLWGDGKGTVEDGSSHGYDGGWDAAERSVMKVDQVIDRLQQDVRAFLVRQDLPADFRAMIEEYADKVTPTGDGAWLKPGQLQSTPFATLSRYPISIGRFPNGTPLTYSGEGSIVTIAPPGSGKTQCNVLPNLLSWKGPAVVLDVSGDLYENTAGWRARNVGPVYKFSPLEPEDSHKYNPLTFVRREADYVWEDARLLAELMLVPTMSSDQYWDNEARTVLTAAIAHVCYSNPPEQRPMHAVLDILYGGKPWDAMLRGLRMAPGIRVMNQHANALESMPEKTLGSVLQVARSSLSAWAGERISRATTASDWSPDDLRNGTNPTVYIYIKPNEVESYLSLLRVFIGQHIRMLTGGKVPERGSPPILVMLDELPRLRNMPPVNEALNIGRKYGLRLWMFAQSVGQLKVAYPDAEGMLAACAVRVYMNPTGADGLAEKISDELGYVDSAADNSRKRVVEPSDLAGPTYRDKQIVIANGAKPVILTKDFASRNPELDARMKLKVPSAGSAIEAVQDAAPAKRTVTCASCGAGQHIPATATKYRCGQCNAIGELAS